MNQAEFMAMVDDRLSDGHRYPTLDEYTAALMDLARMEATLSAAAVKSPATPAVVKCEDCRHAVGRSGFQECRSPKQADWSDRAGADNYSFASTVRMHACHGNWWELRERESAAGQGGRGAAVSNAPRGGDSHASAIRTPNKQPAPSEPGQTLFPVAPTTAVHRFALNQHVVMTQAPPPIRQVGRARHEDPPPVSSRFRLEMRTAGAPWCRTDQPFDSRELADHCATMVRRVQPHVQVRVVDTQEHP